jgi:excisionase family DNA binding protein
MAENPGDKWWTTAEVAERYRVPPATVRYWRHVGRLRGLRLGRRVLYSETEVAAWTDAERAKQASA